MKKILICLLTLLLVGCSGKKAGETGYSYVIVTNGEEIIAAYRDREDVTEERKALEIRQRRRSPDF